MSLGSDVSIRRRRRLVARAALVAASLAATACRSHPSTGPTPRTAQAGDCGGRAAVSVLRATSVRPASHRPVPGGLVVRVAAMDSSRGRPNGTVRLVPTSTVDGGATKVVKLEGSGVARSGPLDAGRWVVEANGRGFETGRLTVAVRSGATDTVRFRLFPACAEQRASR